MSEREKTKKAQVTGWQPGQRSNITGQARLVRARLGQLRWIVARPNVRERENEEGTGDRMATRPEK